MSVTGKAIWYIESHLSEDLSLDAVAGAAGVSRFHLSRAFSVTVGRAVAAYVRSRRLSLAATALVAGATDILTVALDSGYNSHEAFTRAFRQQFGITPESVRERGTLEGLALQEPVSMHKNVDNASVSAPRVVRSEALLIFGIGERYAGTNAGMPQQWERFAPHIGHIPGQRGQVAYGVICNTDEAGSIEYVCGVEVAEFPAEPTAFTRLRIPPQTYAVFVHAGHIATISATWQAIWNSGVSSAGLQATDGPSFEKYGPEFDGRTGLGGLEIWVPIKA